MTHRGHHDHPDHLSTQVRITSITSHEDLLLMLMFIRYCWGVKAGMVRM